MRVAIGTAGRRWAAGRIVLLGALVSSGVAAIVNQIVWQRALKIYLAGSEAVSSMIVVLVFMLGLGVGSLASGRWAHRIAHPLRALAVVELLLLAINLAIASLLALDVGASARALAVAAVAAGVPLHVLYALVGTAILLVPCFLMGVTLPLASEAAQRQLACRDNRFLTVLFALNTAGAIAGTLLASRVLLPFHGQRTALLVAAGCNGIAGLVVLGLARRHSPAPGVSATGVPAPPSPGPRPALRGEEVLGFWVGFLALAFEMVLFRVTALAAEPLPQNFAYVLCGFLLFWSLGMFATRWLRPSIVSTLLIAANGVCWTVLADALLAGSALRREWLIVLYTLPAFVCGLLFGQLMTRVSHRWGNDVGRFQGANTLGSCLGILAVVLVGFAANHLYVLAALGLGYLALTPYARRLEAADGGRQGASRVATVGLAVVAVLATAATVVYGRHLDRRPGFHSYYGAEGVVVVTPTGDMNWDGLWHSSLVRDRNHVGSNNWLLATVPLLARGADETRRALVIGLGTGVTAATLANCSSVGQVDVYEINPQLERLLRDHPEGTLHVAEHPKVRIAWHDARVQLALRDERYDLVSQQPLYLKQAGSSMLLSKEYFELVRQRLEPDGVFAIYCNSGGFAGQALMVRQTAAAVFPYCETFGEGYMVMASMRPIEFSVAHVERALESWGAADPIGAEVRSFGIDRLAAYLDRPRLVWDGAPAIVTDDLPAVEYQRPVHRWVVAYRRERGLPPIER